MSYNITVEGGTTVRLPTAGKYCDRDILVTAEGGGLALDVVTASALPDTVVDGQIVVITDTTPGAVYIDTDEPASPVSGDVWVKLEAGADVVLELSEESPYLGGGLKLANQYDGSGWQTNDGFLGVNGAWEQFSSALPPVGTTIDEMSWADIAKVSASGKAAEYFSIGDTKEITIDGKIGVTTFTQLSIDAVIIGIYHDPEHEGGYYVTFQLGKIGDVSVALEDAKYGDGDGTTNYFVMNSSASNAGGWEGCKMRSQVLGGSYVPTSPLSGSLLAAMPSDLRAVMKGVTKYTDNKGSSSTSSANVTATTDYLWLLSEYEVYGTCSYSNSYEADNQSQYEYYASGNSKIRYRHDNISKTGYWVLRSPAKSNSTYFCACKSDGTANSRGAATNYCVAPAFCV